MIQNAFKIKNGLIVDGNSEVNGYIQFNTGYTPTAQTGKVYYDTTENALSYFPTTPNMDVTLNIGQESFIRVYNGSGAQINNGQVVHISGSTNGLPGIVLANASKLDRSEVSGVATHNIPNGSDGFITNFGVVKDINLSAFRPGDEVYLSDVVDGGITDSGARSIAFTSRVNALGWVITSGATGKLLVRITNEDSTQSLTSKERNILIGNTISTGVFSFSGMTLTVPTTGTTFNVAPVKAWLVDNTSNPTIPTVQLVQYTGGTGLTSPYLNTNTTSYVLLTSAATITVLNTFPTPQQRRQNIYLGKLGHPNKSTFNNVFNEPDYDMSPLSQLRDVFTPIRLINGGVIPTAVGGNLSFKNTSGTLYGLGINYINDILNPNTLAVSANNPTTFQYRTQTGGTATNVTLIDPTLYDVGGTTTAVGGGTNSSTNQRIYILQNGQIRVQYGQVVYGSLSAAIAGIPTESFTVFPNWRDNAILIGVLSVTRSATDLSISTQANFTLPSKFGDVNAASGGGGTSTTTLQQAYDNSTQPEILTNSTLGAVTFKRGSTADTDRVIEVQNNAGVNTFGVTGLGDISGNSLNLKTYLYDSTNTTGTTNQVLFTSPSGVRWNNIDSIVTGLTNNKVIEAGSGILSTVRINANNTTLGNYSGALSGTGNTTPLNFSVIAGGSNNTASGNTASILGGDGNTTLTCYSTVGGGSFNRIVNTSAYSVIAGGIYNRTTNIASLISGGYNNTSSGNYSGIVGGSNNKVLADRSLVGGGNNNTASGTYSFIAGGQSNTSVLTNTFLLGSNLSATTINTTFVENLNVKNSVYDSLGSVGSTGNILIPTATGNQWRSVDNVISGSTSVTSKLNITDFSSYSANTLNTINNNYWLFTGFTNNFNSYSANTLNTINNNYSQFTGFTNSFYSYSSNTLNTINNNYSQFTGFTNSFNSYSAYTLTNINNKVIEVGSGVLSSVRINANNITSGNYSGVLSGTGNTASGIYSSILGGKLNIVTGSTSIIGGGQNNTIASTFSGVGGGCNNDIFSDYSVIGGGINNLVTGLCSVVGGGATNTASAIFTTIGGGSGNTISTIFSTAAGGVLNTASGNYASIGGGCKNVVGGLYGTVAGGRNNSAGGESAIVLGGQQNAAIFTGGAIAGGCLNTSNCFYVTIAGGCCNSSNGDSATIIGGKCNRSSGNCSTISGGYANTVSGAHSNIGGGFRNVVSGLCSGLLSGSGNTVSNCFSGLVSGCRNTVSGTYCGIPAVANTLVGGIGNTINTSFSGVTGINYVGYSFIGGGQNNSNFGTFSTISGGYLNRSCAVSTTVGGGQSNTASGNFSSVIGGLSNTSSGVCSLTGGRLAVASQTVSIALGNNNTSSASYGAVIGGKSNTGSGYGSLVGGSCLNRTSGQFSAAIGGRENNAVGACSFVGGGCFNTSQGIFSGVFVGQSGFTTAPYSVVVGGRGNTASGVYSGILGGSGNTISSTASNSFILGVNISGTTSNTTYINSLALPLATVSNNDAISNYINFTNNNSQIYEDGNLHIHSRSANQSIWINTNNGQLNLLTQTPFAGALRGTGVAIGSTDLIGFVTINTGRTYTTAANYGYLTTAGAGTYPGGSQSLVISLYATSRIWGQEIDAFSDERMKDIIGDIKLDDAIDLVKKLNPIKYTWKDNPDKGIKSGYSAQQVSKAGFDHLISVLPKPGLEETIDEDGYVSPKDTQFSMNYDQVVPYHGRVIKHLLEKIETLEKEISDIKALLNK